MHLDRIDRRLLDCLQKNNRQTSEKLGEIVHLSPAAVQRRLKRLRETGVIAEEVAIIDPKAVGRSIMMFVHVILERERSEVIDRFKRAARASDEVTNAYHVTGEADFVLLVTAPTMEDFEVFTRRFLYQFPEVKTFKTMVVMDRIKTGFAVPIALDD